MKQERNNNHYSYFYRDELGVRRRYGIYAPSIDRFLHISDQDMWMTLETAEILSSKIQTMVYVIPPGYVKIPEHTELISNKNCLEWGIYDKSDLRVGSSNVIGARQTPAIKMLYPDDKLVQYKDLPSDFVDDPTSLNKIKEYADYIYPRLVAVNISSTFYNPYYSKKFIDKYLDEGWSEKTSNGTDHSQVNGGIDNAIKNILYKSDSPQDAEKSITEFWLRNYLDVGYMMTGYYRILGVPVPDKLKPYSATTYYFNHSVWTI
jgi:hypothetical protein